LRSRHPRNPGVFAVLGLAAAALFASSPAGAQVATIAPHLSPVDHLLFARAGTFEVWQDTTRLGTEFYTVYLTAKRDSLIASSAVTYDLHSGKRLMHYEKSSLRIANAIDHRLYVYQSKDLAGTDERALSVTPSGDTTVTIYHEGSGRGDGVVVEIPPGRVYMLDPSIYEEVEWLTRDFAESQIETRKMHALIPPRDTVITFQLTRGPKEKVQGPGGQSINAQRVDVFDDMT